MVVIPLILDEEEIKLLPQECLNTLASCSKDIVIDLVKKYLSMDNTDAVAKDMVEKAYAPLLGRQSYLSSDDLLEAVDATKDIKYSSISPMMTVEELEALKGSINYIITNENSIPYIAPIKGSIIKGLIEEIKVYAKRVESKKLTDVALRLQKYSKYFRESQHASYTGTPVKKIMRNKNEYEIMLRGIDFILCNKKRNISPNAWRYL